MKRKVWLALCMAVVLAFGSLTGVSAGDVAGEEESSLGTQKGQETSNQDKKESTEEENSDEKREEGGINEENKQDKLDGEGTQKKTDDEESLSEEDKLRENQNAEDGDVSVLVQTPRAAGDITMTITKSPEIIDIGGTGEITIALKNNTGSPISLEGWKLQSYGGFAYENAEDPDSQILVPAYIKTYGAGESILANGTKTETVSYKVPKWWDLCGQTMEGGIMLLNKDQVSAADEEMKLTISEVGKPAELVLTVTPGRDMSKIYQNAIYPFTITVKNNSAKVLKNISVDTSFYLWENEGTDWLYSKETYERGSNLTVNIIQYGDNADNPGKGKRPDTEAVWIDELQPGASVSIKGTIMLAEKIDMAHTGYVNFSALVWGADQDIPEAEGNAQINAQFLPGGVSQQTGADGTGTANGAEGTTTVTPASANQSARTGDTASVTLLLVCMGASAAACMAVWMRRKRA